MSDDDLPNIDITRRLIERSLCLLAKRDLYLISENLKEECINHQLASHFKWMLKLFNINDLSVDIEYDKHLGSPKGDSSGKCIRPDIIIHSRGNDSKNYLAIESKKRYPSKRDKEKIEDLLSSQYGYNFGCLIAYLPEKDYIAYKICTKDTDFSSFTMHGSNHLKKL